MIASTARRFLLGGVAVCALLLSACTSDVLSIADGQGKLRLSLLDISSETRSTPAALGVPAATDFQLSIVNSAGRAVYDGAFTDEELSVPVGTYTVTVSYGDNPLLGIDAPYYIGQQTVVVNKDATTHAQLTAAVGNALVSAQFGRDAEERERFDRFYSDYALYVNIDGNGIPISKNNNELSVYVRSGSRVTLRFWGKLKLENDRVVTRDLQSDAFPETLSAADHAIVTLSLPDPESALYPDISKVSLESVTLEETIPLSWLPVPQATFAHQYVNGTLTGTNVTFMETYLGLTWRAVLTNAAGTEVRRVEGTGNLTSAYTSSTDWPYLPKGKYKATYYIISATNGTAKLVSSREFMVDAPSISVSVGGYSSYTKYLEGDIAAANACDRLTVYDPSVAVSIDRSLLLNSHYTYTFTYSYDGSSATAVASGLNSYHFNNFTNQAVRGTTYVLRANATFDGVTASAQKEFRITGLPANFNPPSESNGWSKTTGTVNFESSYVQFGSGAWTNPHSMQNTSWVNIPKDTYICMDYNIELNQGTVSTTFTATAGGQILVQSSSETLKGTSETIQTTSNITVLDCESSWGSGTTNAKAYQLHYKYANQP